MVSGWALDSNLGWRYQKPLPYRLAMPQIVILIYHNFVNLNSFCNDAEKT